MGETTGIEWTEATWNPVVGCSIVSPGCHHCYAASMAKRLRAMALADTANGNNPGRKLHYVDAVDTDGRWTGKLNLVLEALGDPLGWKRPRKVFVNSMSDLFHDGVPEEHIDRVFAVMALTCHTYQVLTKRPERMVAYYRSLSKRVHEWCPDAETEEYLITALHDMDDLEKRLQESCARWLNTYNARNRGWPLPNVMIGVSVEDQRRAEERRDAFLSVPAAIRFVSYEPALGPVDWTGWESVDWIISGGESGQQARPSHPEWHRSTREFCQKNEIAYFFKQWGEWIEEDLRVDANGNDPWPHTWMSESGQEWNCFGPDRIRMRRVGKKAAGRMLDGREWSEFPVVPGE